MTIVHDHKHDFIETESYYFGNLAILEASSIHEHALPSPWWECTPIRDRDQL